MSTEVDISALRVKNLLTEVDKLADEYLSSVRHMSPDKRTGHLQNIHVKFGKSRDFGDDKVQLAMQTYEMVDKHIRKLDADLARFEAELKEKSLSPQASVRDPKSEKKSKKKEKEKDADDEGPKKKKRKSLKPTEPEVEIHGPSPVISLSINHQSDVLDMPVDPNEPTYCLCHQVSYGEMIGCDNLDCPIEWFHFTCVELTTKPKGKWFCPRCQAERKKKP